MGQATDRAILPLIRQRLEALYGSRLAKTVLYGSRARGEGREDSDYDVAVFLRDLTDPRSEADALADLSWEILRDRGVVISAKAFAAADYDRPSLLMETIRNEGVAV
jgi:predicted nucleotidyltransferase